MDINEDWRCHTIVGTSGWGKTQYAKHFIAGQLEFMAKHTPKKSGCVILDIEGDYMKMFKKNKKDPQDGLYHARKYFKAVIITNKTVNIDWYKLLKDNRFVILTPDRSDEAIRTKTIPSQEEWVKVTTEIIGQALLVKNRLIVIEEAHNYGTTQSLPWAITEAIKQGRHRDECKACYSVRIMAITQRANKLNVEYRAQSTYFTSFPQDEQNDIDFITPVFREHTKKLMTMERGESLQYYKNTREISRQDTGYKVVEKWKRG